MLDNKKQEMKKNLSNAFDHLMMDNDLPLRLADFADKQAELKDVCAKLKLVNVQDVQVANLTPADIKMLNDVTKLAQNINEFYKKGYRCTW